MLYVRLIWAVTQIEGMKELPLLASLLKWCLHPLTEMAITLGSKDLSLPHLQNGQINTDLNFNRIFYPRRNKPSTQKSNKETHLQFYRYMEVKQICCHFLNKIVHVLLLLLLSPRKLRSTVDVSGPRTQRTSFILGDWPAPLMGKMWVLGTCVYTVIHVNTKLKWSSKWHKITNSI